MQQRQLLLLLAVLVALICFSEQAEAVRTTTNIGLLLDGDPAVNGFLGQAVAGLNQLKNDYAGVTVTQIPQNFLDLLTLGSSAVFPTQARGLDLIVGVGFQYADPISAWAQQYRNISFILVDTTATVTLPNLVSIIFAEDEGGLLSGIAAGLVSSAKKVGVIAGLEIPPIKRYINGFMDGIVQTCPTCEVQIEYSFSFDDASTVTAMCAKYRAAGVDILVQATGSAGNDCFRAAAAANAARIVGIDSDIWVTIFANGTTPGADNVLISAGKAVDTAVLTAAKSFIEQKFQSGVKILRFANGGYKIYPCHGQGCTVFNPSTDSDFLAARDSLINGEITTGVNPTSGDPLVLDANTNKFVDVSAAYRPRNSIDVSSSIVNDGFSDKVLIKISSLAETWLFYPTTFSWKKLSSGPDRTKGSLASYKSFALFFGGNDNTPLATNTLFRYDVPTDNWTQQAPANTGPSARYAHAAVGVGNDTMYIFGGSTFAFDLSDEMWRFTISTNSWKLMAPAGTPPVARQAHAMALVTVGARQLIFIFGGQDSNQKALGDLVGYEIDSGEGKWFSLNDTNIPLPPRRNHGMTAIGNTLLIVGGLDAVNRKTNTVIRIDVNLGSDVTSAKVSPSMPASLSLHGVAASPPYVYVFGGSNQNNSRTNNMFAMRFNATLDIEQGLLRTVQYVKWKSAAAGIMSAFAALGIAVTVALAVVFLIWRDSPIVKHSHPIFIFASLFGIALIYATVFTFPGRLGASPLAIRTNAIEVRFKSAQCELRRWFGGIGVVVLLGVMIAKTFRLNRILSNTTLLQTAIGTPDLLLYAAIPVAIEIVLLIVWTSASRFEAEIRAAQSARHSVILCYCNHFWPFMGVQMGFVAILIVAGLTLSFKLRSIARKVLLAEPQYIGYSFTTVALGITLVALLSGFLFKFYLGYYITVTLAILIFNTLVLLFLFATKFYQLAFGYEQKFGGSVTGTDFSTDFKPEGDDFNNRG